MEAQMLLRDSEVFPTDEVLKDALGDTAWCIWNYFLGTIAGEEYGMIGVEWKFYSDGKAWLGKAVHKKKTVMWLSVWEGFFRVSFFFTEKHADAILALDISENIKKEFAKAKPAGRLIPMILDINDEKQSGDLLTVVRFKKSLK